MNIKPIYGLFILLIIIYFPLFSCLDAIPLRQWDEARLAVSAFEMSRNGNWLISHFAGAPDMLGTKPPFLIWIMALSFKVFGYNELAVRLPSALAAAITCLFIYWFFTKKIKMPWLGIFSVVILVVSEIYVNIHGSRSGDYDTLLTLLMLLYAVFFFLFIEEGKKKYLLYTFIFLVLASLTKGVHALLFLPALFLYALYSKKLLWVLKHKEFYFGIIAFLFFIPGFYLLREHYNPGYIKAVMENELGGRYNTVLEGHVGGYWYIYDIVITRLFNDWYLLLLPGALIGLSSKNNYLHRLTAFASIVTLSYFLILSPCATKIWWYAMPLAPFLAITVGIFINFIFEFLAQQDFFKQSLRFNYIPYIFVFLVFIIPYRNILNITFFTNHSQFWYDDSEDMTQFLKSVIHGGRSISNCVVPDCTSQNFQWYTEVIGLQDPSVKFIAGGDYGNPENIIAFTPETKDYVNSHYTTHITQSFGSVKVYHVDGLK